MSQASLVIPTSGILSGLAEVVDVNGALDAVATMNSGASPPTNAASPTPAGQMWLNTSSPGAGVWTVEISDGTNWLPVGYVDSVNHLYVPKGATATGADWWGDAAAIPPGSLLAFGQVLNIADFPSLGAKFGAKYGGNGVTTFGMPNKRGRVSAGKDDMGGTAAGVLTAGGSGIVGTTLGAVGGAEVHTLIAAELPVTAYADSGHAHGYTDPGHVHSYTVNSGGSGAIGSGGIVNQTSGTTGRSTIGITINNGSANITNAGGGGAHANVQPTIVCNYIIWT